MQLLCVEIILNALHTVYIVMRVPVSVSEHCKIYNLFIVTKPIAEEVRMGSTGQLLSIAHVGSMVRALRKQQPDLLLISAEDGAKVASHRGLLALFSSTFSQLLADHDQGEPILKVFVEVSSIGLFAFHR